MNALNKHTITFAKSIVAATPEHLITEGRRKASAGLTEEQLAFMERESASLDREFKIIEKDFGRDHLDLTLAVGYVRGLLGNARVVRHLAQHHREILAEFQKITDFAAEA